MPSIRIELYKGKTLSDGKHPVCITVTHKGTPKRKSVDACFVEEWDATNKTIKALSRKDTAKAIQRNDDIDDEFTKYKAKYKELINSGNDWNAEDVFKQPESVKVVEKEQLTFWDITDKYLAYIKAEKSGASYITFKTIVDKFKNHINNDKFKITDFTEDVISGYKAHLRSLGNGDNTMHNAFKVLRFASKYGASKGLCSKPAALHDFVMPKRRSGAKRKLDDADMLMIENAVIRPELRASEARDIFMISYLLRGMRISDVLRMEQSFIKNGRLVYTTSKNVKLFDIKIPAKAIAILEKYLDGRKFVFTYFNWKPDPLKSDEQNRVDEYVEIKRVTAHVNKNLKEVAELAGVTKNVSTHIARHSFAKKALDTIKDTNITMDLLGHSDLSIHQAYIRELSKSEDLDDAADKIFE